MTSHSHSAFVGPPRREHATFNNTYTYRMTLDKTVSHFYALCAVPKLRSFDLAFVVSSILTSRSAGPALFLHGTAMSHHAPLVPRPQASAEN
jgi:hypothetical protein